MLRRSLFALSLAGLAVTAKKAESSTAKSAPKEHKLALQISDNDPVKFISLLQVAVNALNYFADKGEICDVNVVSFGDGVQMMIKESPVKDRIAALRKTFPSMTFTVCKNTLVYLSKKEVREVEVLPGVEVVQAGIGKLVELHEEGYAIVRP